MDVFGMTRNSLMQKIVAGATGQPGVSLGRRFRYTTKTRLPKDGRLHVALALPYA